MRLLPRALLALPLLAPLACGPAAPEGPRSVSGTANFVGWHQGGHDAPQPLDLHGNFVEIQTPRKDGGWDYLPGEGHADGTFRVADVPDGNYWLELYDTAGNSKQFLWTDRTSLDFAFDGLGRSDAVAAEKTTPVIFSKMAGLSPVQDGDGFELVVGNLGLDVPMFPDVATGDTTFNFTTNWQGKPLFSAAKGDQVIVLQQQLTQDRASGVEFVTPVASASLDDVELTDGTENQLTGTFTPPAQLAYGLHWKRSVFAAQKTAIHPTRASDVTNQSYRVAAMPLGAAHGALLPFIPNVMLLDPSSLQGTDDLHADLTVGNPFPRDWLFTEAILWFSVPIPVPGDASQSPTTASVAIGVQTTVLPDAAHPLEPLVTPVRAPTVGGKDLFQDQEGVGLTPVIAWQKPELGTATAYVINVYVWQGVEEGVGSLGPLTTLMVPGDTTQVRMPGRVLEPGRHYVLGIRSLHQEGQDARAHGLYRQAMPYGWADMMSNTFSP